MNEVISREAAEWFVRLSKGDANHEDRQRYVQWLKSSPTHVAEVLWLTRLHRALARAKLHNLTSADARADNVIPLMALRERLNSVAETGHSEPQRDTRNREEPTPVQRPRRGRVAATLASLGLAGLLAVGAIKGLLPDSTLTTDAGEWQKKLLQDGSIVHLGPNTELRLDLAEQRRSIRLVRGEAVFDVARDGRPFVVITDVGSVEALGTEFAVSLADGTALVTVSEGSVAVSEAHQGIPESPTAILLAADQQVVLSRKGVEPVRKVNAARELQWASGWMDIAGRTVGEVARELNRRNRLQIIVSDPIVAALAVPPIPLELDAPETFVSMVSDRRDIAAIRDSAGNIHLQRG